MFDWSLLIWGLEIGLGLVYSFQAVDVFTVAEEEREFRPQILTARGGAIVGKIPARAKVFAARA